MTRAKTIQSSRTRAEEHGELAQKLSGAAAVFGSVMGIPSGSQLHGEAAAHRLRFTGQELAASLIMSRLA